MQTALKKQHYRRQIRNGSFVSPEPEHAALAGWIKDGDWVIDGGANVGYYTLAMSRLVGAGRVLAFEPMPVTFELLACNCGVPPCQNVTLFNAALSSASKAVSMELPTFAEGQSNYYQASIGEKGTGVLALALDSLAIPHRVALIKLDLEGHEAEAIKGMRGLLARDKPRLIVEGNSDEIAGILSGLGYHSEMLPASHNRVWA